MLIRILSTIFGAPSRKTSRQKRRPRGGKQRGSPRAQPNFQTNRAKRSRPPKKRQGRRPAAAQRKAPSRSKAGPKARSKSTAVAYHGTPSADNAKAILNHGWIVGTGNAHGDGIYFGDRGSAQAYAGSSGVLLECVIDMTRTCRWGRRLESQYRQWCERNRVVSDNSARTKFLLLRGFRTLRSGNVIVVLMNGARNPSANKVKTRMIRVRGVLNAATGRPIRV